MAYRREHPRTPKPTLQYEVSNKEVTTEARERSGRSPMFLEVLTLQESAKFLGRTILTLRKWISDELVPPPIWKDTSRGYLHYTVGELTVIKRVLREHEKEYEYLHYTHSITITRMWQNMQGYRDSNI